MNQTGTEFIRRTYYEQLSPSDQSRGWPPRLWNRLMSAPAQSFTCLSRII
mgnify:CR=1 FL=1